VSEGKRRLKAIIALGVLVCALGASQAAHGEVVEIEWLIWGDPASNAIDEEVIAAFERSHPNIKVALTSLPSTTSVRETLVTRVVGGAPPDLALVSRVGDLADGDLIIDLTPYIERDGISSLDYIPSLWEMLQFDGGIYGFPNMRGGPAIIYYNRDLLNEVGLGDPNDTAWDWSTFVEYGKRLKVESNDAALRRWGFTASWDFWWPQVWSNSGELIDLVDRRVMLDQPGAIEALEWWAGLAHVEGIAPDPSMQRSMTGMAWQDGFINQEVGMVQDWAGRLLSRLRSESTFDWDIAPVPRAENGSSITAYTGNTVVMPVGSPNQEAAWTFMRFLGGEEAQTIYGQRGRFFPFHRQAALNTVQDALLSNMSPSRFGMLIELEARAMPYHIPEWDQLSSIFTQELRPAWLGRDSVTNAVSRVVEMGNAVLRTKQ